MAKFKQPTSSICACIYVWLVAVQSLSHIQLFSIPWTAGHQASLSFTISQRWFKLMSVESVMPSNHQFFLASGSFPMSQLFPGSPTLQADSLPSEPPKKFYLYNSIIFSKLSELCRSSIRASEV